MSEIIILENYNEEIAILKMQDRVNNNTFTSNFIEVFFDKLKVLQENKKNKVVILKGLPDIFCAGADKESLLKLNTGDLSVKDLLLSEMVINLKVPVIAAMEGHALGGGFVLGLCCDISLMDEKSNYGVNFTKLGFTPGMGCTRLLQGLVGGYIANEMMFTGKTFKGKFFREKSMANYVLPKEEVMSKAVNIALNISEKPAETIEILKYSLTLKKKQLLAEARVHEDFMHKISFSSSEIKNIIEEMYNE